MRECFKQGKDNVIMHLEPSRFQYILMSFTREAKQTNDVCLHLGLSLSTSGYFILIGLLID